MSLTHDDIAQIRAVIRDEVTFLLDARLKPLEGKLEALENDVKEIYHMLAQTQRDMGLGRNFQHLTLEQKLLRLNTELVAAAKQAGISLPR